MSFDAYHIPLNDLPAGIIGTVSITRRRPLSDETLQALQEMALAAIRQVLQADDENASRTAPEAPNAPGGEVRS